MPEEERISRYEMDFLKKSRQYNEIYKCHNRIKSDHFTLLYQLRDNNLNPAFGIVVRKKVGNSVARNKIKRRIRAFLRSVSNDLAPEIKGIIIAGNDAAKLDWQQMQYHLKKTLVQTKAYR